MLRDLTLDDTLAVVRGMREADRHCVSAACGDIDDEVFAIRRYQSVGPAWSLLQDGAAVAVFGLEFVNDWTAVAWLIATPAISGKSWRKLMRHCTTVRQNLMDPQSRAFRQRVEAHVMDDWHQAAAFAARLGFRFEGTRCAAGRHGEDLQMWAIVNRQETTY